MGVESLFPTLIYYEDLEKDDTKLNEELLSECLYYMDLDDAGHEWSEENYIGGYTSFSSLSNLNEISATFDDLDKKVRQHLEEYISALCLDVEVESLSMSDCWFNVMPAGVSHGLHLHPLSTISGTYYVKTPKNSASIKFEDPRLSKFMAAPPRKKDSPKELKNFVSYPAEVGKLILFESWLRHEVPAADIEEERISVSFNYV